LKWSISAHRCFQRCQRQYYFSNIMAYHNTNDKRRREAYILKQLQNLPAWRGRLFDKGIERFVIPAIKNGEFIDFEQVTQQTIELAHQQFAFSKARKYRDPGTKKGAAGDEFCALFPHEYGLGVSHEEFESVLQDIVCCFENLQRLAEFLDYIRQRKWYGVQRTLSFNLDEVAVEGRPDLLFFRGEGQLTIIDWKTESNETSDNRPQLLAYALGAIRGWPQARLEELEIYEANVMKDEVRRHHVTERDLLETEDFIFSSIFRIRSLIQGGKFSDQHPEDYELANSPNTCQYCSFRKLCLEVLSEDASDQSIRDIEPIQLELSL
jgi:hypothetical protein